jgi:Protein of unknown function (DUF1236)
MTRFLMSGVAVAALVTFGSMAGAQESQMPKQSGGGTQMETQGGASGQAQGGAQMETQGGAGTATTLPEDTQSGQGQQKSSDTKKKSSETQKSSDMKKKSSDTQQSSDTQKSSDEMQKQTEETTGADKTKKQSQTEQDTSGATGATGKAGKIDIPEGKRSQVVKSFSSHKVKKTDIDIDVSIGVAVPRTVVLHPVPVEIVEIVPEFRRYRYFVLANGEIVIVDPDTFVVVMVLAA